MPSSPDPFLGTLITHRRRDPNAFGALVLLYRIGHSLPVPRDVRRAAKQDVMPGRNAWLFAQFYEARVGVEVARRAGDQEAQARFLLRGSEALATLATPVPPRPRLRPR